MTAVDTTAPAQTPGSARLLASQAMASSQSDLRSGQLLPRVPRRPGRGLHRLRGLPVRPGDLLLADQLVGVLARHGLRRAGELRQAPSRQHLLEVRGEQRDLGDRAADRHLDRGADLRVTGHGGRPEPGQCPRTASLEPLPGHLVLSVRDPGHRHRLDLVADLRPEQRTPQRVPDRDRARPVPVVRLAGRRADRQDRRDVRHRVGAGRLLHGAVHRRDQGRTGRRSSRRPGSTERAASARRSRSPSR